MTPPVAVDRRFELDGAEPIDCDDEVVVARWLAAALDAGETTIILVGDDRTLGTFATAQHEVLRDRSELVTFVMLKAGVATSVAEQFNFPDAGKRNLSKLLRRLPKMRAARVSTLRVVDASAPGAQLGFSLGIGSVAELFEGRTTKLRRREAVAQSVRARPEVEADVYADWEHVAEQFGFLLASSLQKSWAGVAMGEGLTLRLGGSPLELVRGATRVGRIAERAGRKRPLQFGRVHIDCNTDYVLDGAMIRASGPRTIALMQGPKVRVLVP